MQQNRFFFVFLFVTVLAPARGATVSTVPGMVEFAVADGRLAKIPTEISIPHDWRGPIRVESDGKSMESRDYSLIATGKKYSMVIAFTDLPGDKLGNTVLIMSGEYVAGFYYQGGSYTKTYDKKVSGPEALKEFLLGKPNDDFKLSARFDFGQHPRPEKPVEKKPKKEVPARRAVNAPAAAADPFGPFEPYGYQRPHYVAGFERNIPYAWSRQGQLQAQAVGTARARLLQDSLRPMGMGFGVFFGMGGGFR